MKILAHDSVQNICGGLSCSEALIQEAIYWNIDDITQYCTKEQYTQFGLAMIDYMYTSGINTMTDEIEIEIIKGLNL